MLSLNAIMNNVEKHWQADSYWTGREVEQPLAQRVQGLNRISKDLEESKTNHLTYSLAFTAGCIITTFTAISSSVLLTTIGLVSSVALALFAWDHFNAFSGMNTLYNIVVEFSDTLESHGNPRGWNTSHFQRCGWSYSLDVAKWYFSNMFYLSNPINERHRDPGLQNLLRAEV